MSDGFLWNLMSEYSVMRIKPSQLSSDNKLSWKQLKVPSTSNVLNVHSFYLSPRLEEWVTKHDNFCREPALCFKGHTVTSCTAGDALRTQTLEKLLNYFKTSLNMKQKANLCSRGSRHEHVSEQCAKPLTALIFSLPTLTISRINSKNGPP